MPKNKSKTKQKTAESRESNKKKFETQVKQFGEEAGALGKKFGQKGEEFGKRMEKHGEAFGKRMERCDECCGRHYQQFGIIGLIFSIIIGILGLALSIWALNFLARKIGSAIIYSVHDFLFSNMGVFILIFLASSILTYLSRGSRAGRLLISPISTAFGITVFFWIASSIILIANAGIVASTLIGSADYVRNHLSGIFWFFLILGYFVVMMRMLLGGITEDTCCRDVERKPAPVPDNGVKRLYRSGKDKILGGVCGGIAEYFNIDPVLIRLLWVLFAIAGGSGILLYIIAWIIIPRNPNQG